MQTVEEMIAKIRAEETALTPEERSARQSASWAEALSHARKAIDFMVKGEFYRTFNCDTDAFDFVYGNIRIPMLGLEDDPMSLKNGAPLHVPCEDMFEYLKKWYWPKRRELAAKK